MQLPKEDDEVTLYEVANEHESHFPKKESDAGEAGLDAAESSKPKPEVSPPDLESNTIAPKANSDLGEAVSNLLLFIFIIGFVLLNVFLARRDSAGGYQGNTTSSEKPQSVTETLFTIPTQV